MGDYYPADAGEVRKHGMRGVISTGAGVAMLLFNTLLHLPVVGWILGGGMIALGIMGLAGKARTDKTTGMILLGAGALGLGSFLLKGLTSFFLGLAGIGLIGFGAFNLIKFVRGLKSRS
ncbi:MAG: hypothetical protein ABIJ86_16595 [Spirochaetota bacterium]